MESNDGDNREIKRVKRTCLNCRRKKVRCGGEQPECSYCVRLGQACKYADHYRCLSVPNPVEDTEEINKRRKYDMLLHRVTSIEAQLSNISGPMYLPSPQPRSSRNNEQQPHFPNPINVGMISNVHPTQISLNQHLVTFPSDIPPPEIAWSIINDFFKYSHNQPYSFFHEANFRACFLDGFLPEYLLLAVLASGLRFSNNTFFNGKHMAAAKAYADKAWSLIMGQCFSDDIVDHRMVQAITLLSIFDFVGLRNPSAWMKIGLAARMALMLKMMLEPDPQLPIGTQEEYRRSFWSIYLLDKMVTCSRGRPASIQDYSCELQLPCTETAFRTSMWQKTLTLGQVNTCDVENRSIHAVGSFGRIVVLVAELHRTALYILQRLNRDNQKAPWDTTSEFSAIRGRLEWLDMEFEFSKPIREALLTVCTDSSDPGKIDPSSAEPLIFSYAIFHLCHCLLQHHFLLRRRLEMNNTQFRASFFTNAIESSRRHAQALAEMLWEVQEAGHSVCASFLGYCSMVAGSINGLHAHSSNESIRLEASRAFEKNINFLSRQSRFWDNAASMTAELQAFRLSASRFQPLIDSSCPQVYLDPADLETLYALVDYGTSSTAKPSTASRQTDLASCFDVGFGSSSAIPDLASEEDAWIRNLANETVPESYFDVGLSTASYSSTVNFDYTLERSYQTST